MNEQEKLRAQIDELTHEIRQDAIYRQKVKTARERAEIMARIKRAEAKRQELLEQLEGRGSN